MLYNPVSLYMLAAAKLMFAILLRWPTLSEADVGGMTAESEPSHQYFITYCSFEIDGSRESV